MDQNVSAQDRACAQLREQQVPRVGSYLQSLNYDEDGIPSDVRVEEILTGPVIYWTHFASVEDKEGHWYLVRNIEDDKKRVVFLGRTWEERLWIVTSTISKTLLQTAEEAGITEDMRRQEFLLKTTGVLPIRSHYSDKPADVALNTVDLNSLMCNEEVLRFTFHSSLYSVEVGANAYLDKLRRYKENLENIDPEDQLDLDDLMQEFDYIVKEISLLASNLEDEKKQDGTSFQAVSYTHLTLPTILLV